MGCPSPLTVKRIFQGEERQPALVVVMLQPACGGRTHPQVSLHPLALHARDSFLQRSEHSVIVRHAPRRAPAIWALFSERCVRPPESSKVPSQQRERIGGRVGPIHKRRHELERAIRCRHAARRNLLSAGQGWRTTVSACQSGAACRRLARARPKLNSRDNRACAVWRSTNAA